MSAITDCIIMVLIMRHGNAGEENIVLTSMEEFILQCRGVRENQIRCVNFSNIHK